MNIGFIGLGEMGTHIAANLVKNKVSFLGVIPKFKTKHSKKHQKHVF